MDPKNVEQAKTFVRSVPYSNKTIQE